MEAEALTLLRGVEAVALKEAEEVIPGLKREMDPTLPEEMRTGAGYQKYFREFMQKYEKENENEEPEERSQTAEERAYLRLFRKIRLLSMGVMETDYKVWPVGASTHETGTSWGQPSWRLRLMRAFMIGASADTEGK